MEPSQSTSAPAEPSALPAKERERRLALLAERLVAPDGLDREALANVEQLTPQDS